MSTITPTDRRDQGAAADAFCWAAGDGFRWPAGDAFCWAVGGAFRRVAGDATSSSPIAAGGRGRPVLLRLRDFDVGISRPA
ncbi:MAG: hypothetical protein ABR564_04415 [Candidatus Dormibacteria bacterium]